MKTALSRTPPKRPISRSGRPRTRLVSPEVESRSARFYRVSQNRESITCVACGSTSQEPGHVSHKFCPRCQVYHDDRGLMLRLAEGYQHAFCSSEKDFRIAA